tara:strand:- start:2194 stop:2409 length:216 start_codon:yes stop_codon:yes gene_type:complete
MTPRLLACVTSAVITVMVCVDHGKVAIANASEPSTSRERKSMVRGTACSVRISASGTVFTMAVVLLGLFVK